MIAERLRIHPSAPRFCFWQLRISFMTLAVDLPDPIGPRIAHTKASDFRKARATGPGG